MIFKIYSRILKQKKSASTTATGYNKVVRNQNEHVTKVIKSNNDISKIQNEFIFKNADEEPNKNPFEDAFKDL